MHPLLGLIATRPQLLAEHAQAYAELMATEWPLATTAWKRRALLQALALLCTLAAAILGGVALMLWAVVMPPPLHAAWLLVGVPLLPAAAALLCWTSARPGTEPYPLDALKQQFSADLEMLRKAVAE